MNTSQDNAGIAVLQHEVIAINKKLDSVETKLEKRLTDFTEIGERLLRVEISVESINDKIENFDGKISKFESKLDEHQTLETQLSNDNTKKLDEIMKKLTTPVVEKSSSIIKEITENKLFMVIILILVVIIGALLNIDISPVIKLFAPV